MDEFVIAAMPAAHVGAGAIEQLPAIIRAIGAEAVVVVTDEAPASAPAVATVTALLADAAMPARVFSGVHQNPSTDDVAAGAAAVAEAAAGAAAVVEAAAVTATLRASAPLVARCAPANPRTALWSSWAAPIALVAVGGGSCIDAAKGIAIAAVNPERGRGLDGRPGLTVPALPIVAVPTTAGTGAEANALGLVTDLAAGRGCYVGQAGSMPAATILDPVLTVSLPPEATAAAGLDALTNALESYLSPHANPWSDGIALQAIRMIAANLEPAVEDGTDLAARSQLLLAAHMAGIALAHTGPGLCHAIGRSLSGRPDIARDATPSMLLPDVLRFRRPARTQQLADVAFALGVGESGASPDRNATAAIDAVAALRARVGLTALIADFGITEAHLAQLARDALDEEALASTSRPPVAAGLAAVLAARG
ncbi:MAG: iron-containing alcohol dehydrogenase [Streptosporangiaceae bacterium]